MKVDLRIIVFFFLIGFLDRAHTTDIRFEDGCPPIVVYGEGPTTTTGRVLAGYCDPNVRIVAMHNYISGVNWEEVGSLLGQNPGANFVGLSLACQGLDPSLGMTTAVMCRASGMPFIGFKDTLIVNRYIKQGVTCEVGLGCNDPRTRKFIRFQSYLVTPEGCISKMKLKDFLGIVLRPGKRMGIIGSQREAIFYKTLEGDIRYLGSWDSNCTKFTRSQFKSTNYQPMASQTVRSSAPRAPMGRFHFREGLQYGSYAGALSPQDCVNLVTSSCGYGDSTTGFNLTGDPRCRSNLVTVPQLWPWTDQQTFDGRPYAYSHTGEKIFMIRCSDGYFHDVHSAIAIEEALRRSEEEMVERLRWEQLYCPQVKTANN